MMNDRNPQSPDVSRKDNDDRTSATRCIESTIDQTASDYNETTSENNDQEDGTPGPISTNDSVLESQNDQILTGDSHKLDKNTQTCWDYWICCKIPKKDSKTVQIMNAIRTERSVMFAEAFKTLFKKKKEYEVRETCDEADAGVPLLVLCSKLFRLKSDVDYAISLVKSRRYGDQPYAIVICHAVKNDLPVTPSKETFEGYNNITFIDMEFRPLYQRTFCPSRKTQIVNYKMYKKNRNDEAKRQLFDYIDDF